MATATKDMELVYVEWLDSGIDQGGWRILDDDSPAECLTVYSVGWVYSQTDTTLRLVPHYIKGSEDAEEQCLGSIAIPMPAIVRMIRLPYRLPGRAA